MGTIAPLGVQNSVRYYKLRILQTRELGIVRMELPHLGRHCSEPTCRMLDFLPMKCDACSQIFCTDHLQYDDHKCSSSYKKNIQVTRLSSLSPLTVCTSGARVSPVQPARPCQQRSRA